MYIIDGYNLLHTVIKTDESCETITDIQLCRIINNYFQITGQKGELVFDGTGPREKNAFENLSNLEVFFAGAGTDADTIIEDKIKADSAPKRLVIVSSDRRLRKAAHAKKSVSVKTDEFWTNLNKQLNKKRPIREPGAKRQGLTESETKKWLEIFGIEQ
ncbi:MAG: NYN domain-containing protein [Sedimentisphaerales bacterium]|nr:NYN domain-containing protein [Sedimentisphaerales bacterium]